MKLTYRGVSYDYNPPQVEVSNSNTVGKYRGLDVRFRNPKKNPVQQPTLDLVYRNVAYTANAVPEAAVAAPVATPAAAVAIEPVSTVPAIATVLSIHDRARSLMMNHHRSVKRRQQAMLSRLDAEVGLDAGDASHYWNHVQGKVHPSFWGTYDRGHASLS
ncbi:DUF4278 domain-containing protein [Oculatella sp. LEGE 06141]|uniref:DUF4278 domain-containing protein n=1 Tax=Oculatella sp. LEGE 06141 TaxID=1828648 RepID=UPI00187E28B4|nr:DUF4278 domain-containing protein [Oculatella sp. LEGE 06141]MBE9181841.1 DUF4278 domain-containing protein [Oculatella sp. LEGE 06141]